MSLFVPTVHLQFTHDEWDQVTKPIVAKKDGGLQIVLRRVQSQLKPDRSAVLEDAEIQQCYHYGYEVDYDGGYEGRCKAVVKAALRAGWMPA